MLIIIQLHSYSTGNSMEQRARIIIKGIVQGVFFRDSTRRKAQEFHVTGIVRNRPDGSVEIICEGDEASLNRLIEWTHRGPPGARVEHIDVSRESYVGEFKDFRVVY
jgi:acylphosphatase